MEEKVVLRISTEGGLPDNRQMYKSKTQMSSFQLQDQSFHPINYIPKSYLCD